MKVQSNGASVGWPSLRAVQFLTRHDMSARQDAKIAAQTTAITAYRLHHGQCPNSRSHSESFPSAFR